MGGLTVRFSGQLWEYQGEEPWVFMTLPTDCADQIDDAFPSRRGFGSIPVVVSIGESTWRTSLFPDKAAGSFLLPVKKSIRDSEHLAPGDRAEVLLQVDHES